MVPRHIELAGYDRNTLHQHYVSSGRRKYLKGISSGAINARKKENVLRNTSLSSKSYIEVTFRISGKENYIILQRK